MRRITLSIAIVLLSVAASLAQYGKINYDISVARFQHWYNEKQADSIYSTFGAVMRNALTPEKTAGIINTLHEQAGKLNKMILVKEEPKMMTYTGEFDNTKLTILYSLNEQNELQGLLFKPYEDPQHPAAAPMPEPEYTVTTPEGAPISGTLLMPGTPGAKRKSTRGYYYSRFRTYRP